MFKLNNSSASKIAVGILSAVITLSLSYSLASASTTNDQSIRLRQEPNTSSAILKTLDKNVDVTIVDVCGDWLKVIVDNQPGYIRSDLVKVEEPENATIIDGPTRIRKTPNMINNSNVVDNVRLNKDDRITVISQAGDFYCIQYNNQIYYVHTTLVLLDIHKEQALENAENTEVVIADENVPEEVVQEVEEREEVPKSITTETILSTEYTVGDTVYSLVNGLNFRTDKTTQSASRWKISAGTPLTVLEIYEGWVKVSQTDGEVGFVSRDYITKSKDSYSVIDQAKQLLGIPYNQSYNGIKMDCSGLTYYIFNILNGVKDFPRCSYEQAGYKNAIEVSFENLQPGDLVFFYGGCSHVGIYIGNGEFIHAENWGYNSRITSFYGDSRDYNHWGEAFTKGLRLTK
ncbi:MAG: C40 family peptidase [Clostridia bacterium]|nr:C40 family peptidase [Clostridia bacterium]